MACCMSFNSYQRVIRFRRTLKLYLNEREHMMRFYYVCTVAAVSAAFASSARADGPPPLPSVQVTTDGALSQYSDVYSRDGDFSVLVGKQALFVFRDTGLNKPNEAGTQFIHNSLSAATDLKQVAPITLDKNYVDKIGGLKRFVPLTAYEQNFNEQHAENSEKTCKAGTDCGSYYEIWPGQPVYDSTTKLLYVPYGLVQQPKDHGIGDGFAVGKIGSNGWPDLTRPDQNLIPGGHFSSLMFPAGTVGFGPPDGFIQDGNYYAYSENGGLLAQVPVSKILDRTQWKFWAPDNTWSSNIADAVESIPETEGDGWTVFYDKYLSEWVDIYCAGSGLNTTLKYRVAYNLTGPWSEPGTLVTGLVGADNTSDYEGHAHPEFSPDNGQTEYVTITNDTSTSIYGPAQNQPLYKVVFSQPQ